MENSLFVANWPKSIDELVAWVGNSVGEVAICQRCVDSDDILVELVLENEIEVLLGRIAHAWPHCVARRASCEEYDRERGRVAVSQFRLCLGSTVEVSLDLSPSVGGGTGSKLWPGGLLLAEHLMLSFRGARSLGELKVLELGAGAGALPSIAAYHCGRGTVVATDCVASVVRQMSANLQRNAGPAVEAKVLDWKSFGTEQRDEEDRFDLILFSDGIYNQRGAFFLAMAIGALLRHDGEVIGALPDTRSGIVAFEADLAASGFTATPVPIDPAVMDATARHMASDDSAVVVPEGLSRYRLVRWHRKDE